MELVECFCRIQGILFLIVGFGWARSYGSNQHNDEIAAALGILNTFRLNKRIDLTLGTRQMFVNQNFDGVVGGCKGEGMSSVTLGLNFKLGKTTFTPVSKVATADYSRYNNYINELRIQNEELDSKVQHLITELENASLKLKQQAYSSNVSEIVELLNKFFKGNIPLELKKVLLKAFQEVGLKPNEKLNLDTSDLDKIKNKEIERRNYFER